MRCTLAAGPLTLLSQNNTYVCVGDSVPDNCPKKGILDVPMHKKSPSWWKTDQKRSVFVLLAEPENKTAYSIVHAPIPRPGGLPTRIRLFS